MTWIPPHVVRANIDGSSGTIEWPSTYTAKDHTHSFASITGKPGSYAPSAHTHSASDVNLPSTYTPSGHTHSFNSLTDQPSVCTPRDHTHSWASITDRPSDYTPATHTHSYSSARVQVSTTSTIVFTANGTETVVVMAKGDITGFITSPMTMTLRSSATTKDTCLVRQSATTNFTPFYMQYTEVPPASTQTVQIQTTGGTINRPSIIVMRLN